MEKSQYGKEKFVLSGVFPELVWIQIFDKLKNSHTEVLENASVSTAFLRGLLLSKRIYYLFPKVLLLLAAEIDTSHRPEQPPYSRWSAGKTLLNLRVVCKAWSNTVDALASTLNSSVWTKLWETDATGEVQPRFLSNFANSHQKNGNRGPFIGNSVWLLYHRLAGVHAARNAQTFCPFEQILQMYGSHIRNCTLTISLHFSEALLCQSIAKMPNVKNLTVFSSRLVWSINGSSIPELPSLESLDVEELPANILEYLLCKTPNLKTLKLRMPTGFPCNIPKLGASLHKLQHLNVEMKRNYRKWDAMDSRKSARGSIFQWLEAFSGLPIQTLKLSLRLKNTRKWSNYKLQFPRLTNLVLIGNQLPSLDFLCQFQDTLESLTVKVSSLKAFAEWKRSDTAASKLNKAEVNLQSFVGVLMKMKFWNDMSNLKAVTIGKLVEGKAFFKKVSWNRETGKLEHI